MKELIEFVSISLVTGVVGNVTYDELKTILGSSFNKLTNYLSNNEKAKFEGALEMLIEQNVNIKQEIEKLQKSKIIETKSYCLIKDKEDVTINFNNSITIGGSNSGNIITGDNNTINGKSNIVFK